MEEHHIVSEHLHDMAFKTALQGHELITDSPLDASIPSEGGSPKRLMLVSIAGCTGIDVASILAKMKVDFSQLSIEVTGKLGEEQPKVYKEVFILYKIKLAPTNRIKMEKAVQLSQDKYCGVIAMFKTFAKVSYEIEYV